MSGSLIQALILLVAILAAAALVHAKAGAGRPLLWAGAAILSVGKLIPVVVLSVVGFGAGSLRGQGFPGRGPNPGSFPSPEAYPTMGGGYGRGNFPQGGFQNGPLSLATTLGGWLDTAFTLAGVMFLILAIVQSARGAKVAAAPASAPAPAAAPAPAPAHEPAPGEAPRA